MFHLEEPPEHPKQDDPLDPNLLNKQPKGTGGPVVFSATSEDSTFQHFMWDLTNALHLINLGLTSYKRLRAWGCPEGIARAAYDSALRHYNDIFKGRWAKELSPLQNTHLTLSISLDGYITDVRVMSTAFSRFKPLQSSSLNSLLPYPSSSSSSSSSAGP